MQNLNLPDFSKIFRDSNRALRRVRRALWLLKGFPKAKYDPPPDSLHPKVIAWAHAAHPLLSDTEGIDSLLRRVAKKRGQSPKTAYKWLCERNPMYEPGGSMERRWKCLRTAVLRTYAHVPPP